LGTVVGCLGVNGVEGEEGMIDVEQEAREVEVM